MRPAMTEASAYARGTLLDIGCGLRPYEPIFSRRVDRYIGLDWPSLPEASRMDIAADALRLPLANASVDTVVATEVMEHLPDPNLLLAEIGRVTRSPGALILSVPFLAPLHEEPRDFYRFTPYSLRLLLEQHGFETRQIWSRGGWWSVVGSFISQALYARGNPVDASGRRRRSALGMALTLPFCGLAQWLGYTLDRFVRSPQYTLGYIVVAVTQPIAA
jgi:SAM-dependent methyltransferase